MKKLKYVILLLVLACASFAVACAQEPTAKITLSGFALTDTEITVNAGDIVPLHQYIDGMYVTDQDGKEQKVMVEVSTATSGNEVYVTYDTDQTLPRFAAVDTEGYVVKYKVYTSDKRLHTLTQSVKVTGEPTVCIDDTHKLITLGDTVNIVASSFGYYENAALTYEYKKASDTSYTAITNGTSFIPDSVGIYDIKVTANAQDAQSQPITASNQYQIFVREAMQEGEVEVFDENWATIRELLGYKGGTVNGEYKTTEELGGLKDHNGLDSGFMAVSGTQYIPIWINPRGETEYYQKLLDNDGYLNISVWIYFDCGKEACTSSHNVRRVIGINNLVEGSILRASGQETIATVKNKEWTEIKLRLKEPTSFSSTSMGSFIKSLDFYKRALCQTLTLVSHSDSVTTVYVDDVYATKSLQVEFNTNLAPQQVGQTFNIADAVTVIDAPEGFDKETDLCYYIKKDGEEDYTLLEGSTYTFDNTEFDYNIKIASRVPSRTGSYETIKLHNPNILIGIGNEQNRATYDLGIGAVSDYTLTQYVFKGTDADRSNPLDVKAKYADLIDANGVVNMSLLDGYFRLSAQNASGETKTIEFEQYNTNNFVWNNLYDASTAILSSSGDTGYNYEDATKGQGTASVSVVDASTSSDTALTGKTGKFYKVSDVNVNANSGSWHAQLRVLPIHSAEYFDIFVGTTVSFSYYFDLESSETLTKGSVTDKQVRVKAGNYMTGNTTERKGVSVKTWYTGTFTINEQTFTRATKLATSSSSSNMLGSFIGLVYLNDSVGYKVATGTVYDYYMSADFNVVSKKNYKVNVENYLEQEDGSYKYGFTDVITEVDPQSLEYIHTPENVIKYNDVYYRFDSSNANNSLTATLILGDHDVTVKRYYRRANEYSVEYYLFNPITSQYDLDESLSTKGYALVGETIELEQKTIPGYYIDIFVEDTLLLGTIEEGEMLALKAYYNLSPELLNGALVNTKNDLYRDYGIGEVGSNYTVTQYVFRDDGEVTLASGEKVKAVDVTAEYPNLFTSGSIANLKGFDGYFTITATGTNGTITEEFEGYTADKYVWNNILHVDNGSASLLLTGEKVAYGGTATLTTQVATDLNPVSGKTSGTYVLINNVKGSELLSGEADKRTIAIRVFPTHSVRYLELFLQDYTVDVLITCRPQVAYDSEGVKVSNTDSSTGYGGAYGKLDVGIKQDYGWYDNVSKSQFSVTTSLYDIATSAALTIGSNSVRKMSTFMVAKVTATAWETLAGPIPFTLTPKLTPKA